MLMNVALALAIMGAGKYALDRAGVRGLGPEIM